MADSPFAVGRNQQSRHKEPINDQAHFRLYRGGNDRVADCYWNGRFLQNNKEYAKAIESYELVIQQGPEFALSDDADFGIVECLTALGKSDEALKHNAALLKKYDRKTGPTAVLRLAERTTASRQ